MLIKKLTLIIILGFFTSCGLTFVISKDSEKEKIDNNIKISKHKGIKRAKIPANRLEYISMYKSLAVDKMEKYNIPASITLAQGILESGAGTSELAVNSNNHFGIKCGSSWEGMIYYKDDDKKHDCFRVYNKVEKSFEDHSKILLKSRYKRLFDLDMKDYKGWAKGLKSCGYATNPKYPEILISIINKYKLYEYDNLSNETTIKKNTSNIGVNNKTISEKVSTKEVKNKDIKNSNSDIVVRKTLTSFISAKDKKTKVYVVKKGDTLYSISKNNKVDLNKIKELNNLKSNNISIGQKLILE